MVLPCPFDRHGETHPLGHPLQLPRQFSTTIERRYLPFVAAATSPLHHVRPAAIAHFLPVVIEHFRRPDSPAILADGLERIPSRRPIGVAHLLVYLPHLISIPQNRIDRGVE